MNGDSKHFEPQNDGPPPDPPTCEEVMVADVRSRADPGPDGRANSSLC